MHPSVIVFAIAAVAAVVLYGVARLVVWGLPRILSWRSPLRLLAVVVVWFGTSALLMTPLYAMLLAPSVMTVGLDGWFLVWVLGCFAACITPFGAYVSRHRGSILRAGKQALAA
jgi:hypothetical protein